MTTEPGAQPSAADLTERFEAAGQGHVCRYLPELSEVERDGFLRQLAALDLPRLETLIGAVLAAAPADATGAVEPPDLIECADDDAGRARDDEARAAGEEYLAAGRVAAFMVAGGQGTRLGYDGPKGRFPVGPLTQRSLFAYHAQRVRATSRRYGATAPFYVMTSDATHESTVAAFGEAGWFGLDPEQVHFLTQGTLPAIDHAGRLLLASKSSLALSPDGHGGSFAALSASGALARMAAGGVDQIFYFQVDNPLAPVLDPVFIGHQVLAGAEMSTKVVAKTEPGEKVGVLARVDGRVGVIEYSDLGDELAQERDERGRLRFRAGNIAIHMLDRAFVERLVGGDLELPVHRAEKKVPCIDERGVRVEPTEPNAIKMELFVFDALPLAARTVTQEVRREDEFAPVKNAQGSDSPRTASDALADQARRWMGAAGLAPPRDLAEVGPLFALDVEEFRRNLTERDTGPVFDRS